MKPYWTSSDGRLVIYHGDCLDVLTEMDERSVGMIVTDPPYFVPANHYSTRKSFPRTMADLSILERFYRDWFAASVRVLHPTGVYYVFCDGQSYPVFFIASGQYVKSARPLVWDKQVSINGYTWRHQHELILYGEREGSPAIKNGDGDVLQHRATPIDDRDHPAQKPVGLLARLIAKHDAPVVLDPFAGSGSTLLAAQALGRRAIGIEIEERYAEIAARRLEDPPMLAAVKAEQADLFAAEAI